MDTTTISSAASSSKQKFIKACAFCAAFLTMTLAAPRIQATATNNANATGAVAAEEQQGKQRSSDRVVVTLSDPSRPARVKASLINGGITVKAHEGKDIIVEAHARNRDDSDDDNDRPGPKRLTIATTGATQQNWLEKHGTGHIILAPGKSDPMHNPTQS